MPLLTTKTWRIYEMKASAWYQVTYHPEIIRSREPGDEDAPTRLSFAWIAVDYLAQIKMKRHLEMEVEEGRSSYIF
jgi:RNA-dependent RNA polymerase